jgi:hypothetical protein
MRLIEFAGAKPYAPSADDAADSSNSLTESGRTRTWRTCWESRSPRRTSGENPYSMKRCRRTSTVVAFAIARLSDRPCNAFPPNFTMT